MTFVSPLEQRLRSQIRRICSALQNLDWKYFQPPFKKNKMAATGVFFLSVMKSAYISLIIGPRALGWKTNLQEIMGWESFGVVGFDLGLLLQGQTRIAKLKGAYNSLIIGPRCLGW